MQDVIISIQPKWVEKIANGEKTVEVRKTRPKINTPFKCYIYETKAKKHFYSYIEACECPRESDRVCFWEYGSGKIIGEFICDKIIEAYKFTEEDFEQTCLSKKEYIAYAKTVNQVYGWHISDLKIYDKPKELSKFWTVKCTNNYKTCGECKDKPKCIKTITRPPQSWCYVKGENK